MQTPLKKKPNFQFYNNVSPRYIELIFLPLNYGEWYTINDIISILRQSGLDIKGEEIVRHHVDAWKFMGVGETIVQESRNIKLFRLTEFGKQIQDIYSTNKELFFDLFHYSLYSTWMRTLDVWRGRFWLYASICDDLWENAPAEMDNNDLAGKMQRESQILFSEYQPSFTARSVRAVYPWLGVLTPPFLKKCVTKSQLCSERRTYCTPQLFHLASNLVYSSRQLRYGTSIAIDNTIIQAICKTCLLDPDKFWDMADRTQMSSRGFEIRKGQWGTSLSLDGPPGWIELPKLEPYQPDVNDLEGGE